MSGHRFERLEALKAEAAGALNLPIDADRVVMLAALKLQHQTMLESLVGGRNIDADALLAITRAISELLPPPVPQIPEVKIEIVDTLVGICGKCGHEHRPYRPPVEDPKPNAKPSPPPPEAVSCSPAPPTNVIEMRPRSTPSLLSAADEVIE
jgi:hypothetical protein